MIFSERDTQTRERRFTGKDWGGTRIGRKFQERADIRGLLTVSIKLEQQDQHLESVGGSKPRSATTA